MTNVTHDLPSPMRGGIPCDAQGSPSGGPSRGGGSWRQDGPRFVLIMWLASVVAMVGAVVALSVLMTAYKVIEAVPAG